MGILEEIKEELCGDGVPWLKQIKGLVQRKFSMKDMKLMDRAWGSFVVHTIESCGNSSDFRFVRAVIVKAIIKDDEINIGRIITDDMKRIVNIGFVEKGQV